MRQACGQAGRRARAGRGTARLTAPRCGPCRRGPRGCWILRRPLLVDGSGGGWERGERRSDGDGKLCARAVEFAGQSCVLWQSMRASALSLTSLSGRVSERGPLAGDDETRSRARSPQEGSLETQLHSHAFVLSVCRTRAVQLRRASELSSLRQPLSPSSLAASGKRPAWMVCTFKDSYNPIGSSAPCHERVCRAISPLAEPPSRSFARS